MILDILRGFIIGPGLIAWYNYVFPSCEHDNIFFFGGKDYSRLKLVLRLLCGWLNACGLTMTKMKTVHGPALKANLAPKKLAFLAEGFIMLQIGERKSSYGTFFTMDINMVLNSFFRINEETAHCIKRLKTTTLYRIRRGIGQRDAYSHGKQIRKTVPHIKSGSFELTKQHRRTPKKPNKDTFSRTSYDNFTQWARISVTKDL